MEKISDLLVPLISQFCMVIVIVFIIIINIQINGGYL